MYASLKPWMNVPVVIKPYLKRGATGDKIFGDEHTELCYPQGEVNIVRNWQGVEVVSHNHLYFDGSVQVSKLDNILFEGEDLPVQAISNYYRDGKIDIRVVYV